MVSHPSIAKINLSSKEFINHLTWTIYNSSAEIDKNFLKLLAFTNTSLEEYKQIESFSGNAQTKFVCVSNSSSPILLFPIQEVWLSKSNFPSLKRTFWQRITSLLIDISCINLVFAGSLLQIDKSYLAFDDATIDEYEAYIILLHVLNQINKSKSYAAQLVHIPNHVTHNLEKTLITLGFTQPLPDFEMHLELRQNWVNWESYHTDLTKKYAARAKKIREASTSLSLKTLSLNELKQFETEIQLLYIQTVQKQDVALVNASKGYFTSLKVLHGEHFQVKGYFKEEKLVAFYTWFEKEESIEMHFIGLDYNLNPTYNLYFNILFDGMLDAIMLKKKYIHYGRTCLDAKASVGAVASPSASYLKLEKVHNCVTETIQNYISKIENDSWKNRNPLKN